MQTTIRSIEDVASYQLCSGCGLCAYIEPERYRMSDALQFGRRPFVLDESVPETGAALSVCPGITLSSQDSHSPTELIDELLPNWGPILKVFEGYATDDEIRYAGSSGGVATALALFCIEESGMHGILHSVARTDIPFQNHTVMSRSREELLYATGSRYAPASPCEKLELIELSEGQSIFIGKPCDVAGVEKARKVRPTLDSHIALTIAFFCAGVPSTKGTIELLKLSGINKLQSVRSLRYRGNGWPGLWTAKFKGSDGLDREKTMTYTQSWGFLQKYRQWRCYICPDHTGEYADIALGDPWYRKNANNDPGRSLIIARTKHGLGIIQGAADRGYITLEKSDPTILPRSQRNLLFARASLWARLKVLRLLGAPTPSYTGFNLFWSWRSALTPTQKFQSITGTAKRVFTKRLRQKQPVIE